MFIFLCMQIVGGGGGSLCVPCAFTHACPAAGMESAEVVFGCVPLERRSERERHHPLYEVDPQLISSSNGDVCEDVAALLPVTGWLNSLIDTDEGVVAQVLLYTCFIVLMGWL